MKIKHYLTEQNITRMAYDNFRELLEGDFKKAVIETEKMDISASFIDGARKRNMSLWDYLATVILNPDKNNFNLKTLTNNFNFLNKEVWLEGPCLFERVFKPIENTHRTQS